MSDANSCSNCTSATITADCSVDAVLRKSPTAQAVLDGFGIDTCCGGNARLRDAAIRAHIDPAVVLDALNAPPPVALISAASAACA